MTDSGSCKDSRTRMACLAKSLQMEEAITKPRQRRSVKLSPPETYARRFMAQIRRHLLEFRRANYGRVPPIFPSDQVDLSILIELVRTMSSYSTREATARVLNELTEALLRGRLHDHNGDLQFCLEHAQSPEDHIKPGGIFLVGNRH